MYSNNNTVLNTWDMESTVAKAREGMRQISTLDLLSESKAPFNFRLLHKLDFSGWLYGPGKNDDKSEPLS